ncbi:MAG: flavodoxin-dependent (E)-4-hydroxy-3-methylbut-2-enyl-diphosphate synthase, partial [Clostridia bacterium]|nr:flavodoxin-dependent (E)-4-hydroxy-3-methylbut-2-enyl-diphosphate synthase [Clostridia bacterium]
MKQATVKNIKIGGGAPISIQSMTNLSVLDIDATLEQIKALECAG